MVPYTNSKSHFLEKRGTTPKVVPNTNLALKSFKPQPPRSFLLDKSKNTLNSFTADHIFQYFFESMSSL